MNMANPEDTKSFFIIPHIQCVSIAGDSWFRLMLVGDIWFRGESEEAGRNRSFWP